MNKDKEQINITLEDNIINIPVPNTIPETEINHLNQVVTPIPEVVVEEHQAEEKNNNPMIEKKQEDEKITGKSLAPLIIIFSIFIISIVGLPYIDDLIALINPPVEEKIIPNNPENTIMPTPSQTPLVTSTPSSTIIPSEVIDNLTQ